MISADDFLQTCYQDMLASLNFSGLFPLPRLGRGLTRGKGKRRLKFRLHVSTIIVMRKCDSKYREICFNRALIITHSQKI